MIRNVTTKIKEKITKIDKKIAIGVGLSLVLLASLIIVFANRHRRDVVLENIFDPDAPIAVQFEDTYGYVNRQGETLIEPAYLTAGPFYGQYAAVSLADGDREIYKIIDTKGSTILTSTSANKPRYYKEYGVWLVDNKIYSSELKKLAGGDRHITYIDKGYFAYQENDAKASGIIDYQGKKVFSWDENYISVDISKTAYDESLPYAAISNYEERESIISLRTGKELYTLSDPKNRYLEVEPDNVFRIIDRQDSYKTVEWLYLSDDKIAFQTSEEIYDISIDDYLKNILKIDYGVNYEAAGRSERYAYYDVANGRFLDAKYGASESTTKNDWMEKIYGYKTYTCSGLYGLMEKDKILTDCTNRRISFLPRQTYDYMNMYYQKPIAIIEGDADVLIYNLREHRELAHYEVASLTSTDDSTFLIVTEYESDGFTKKNYVAYNLITDAALEFASTASIAVHSNYLVVTENGKDTYYDVELDAIFEFAG